MEGGSPPPRHGAASRGRPFAAFRALWPKDARPALPLERAAAAVACILHMRPHGACRC